MKIAAVSEDGVTISQHFGEPHEEAQGADPRSHGFDAGAQSRHARMAAAIADCQSSWKGQYSLVRHP